MILGLGLCFTRRTMILGSGLYYFERILNPELYILEGSDSGFIRDHEGDESGPKKAHEQKIG